LAEAPRQDYYNISFLKKEILESSSDSLKDYLSGSNYDKYCKVKEISKNNLRYEFIPVIKQLSTLLDEDYKSFENYISSLYDNISELPTFAALELSDYANENQDFRKAKMYAEIALEQSTNEFNKSIIQEKIRKFDWIMKYKSSLIN